METDREPVRYAEDDDTFPASVANRNLSLGMIWPKRDTYFHIRLNLRTVMCRNALPFLNILYLNKDMLKFGGKNYI